MAKKNQEVLNIMTDISTVQDHFGLCEFLLLI